MATTTIMFDPFSREYFDDATEVYRRLRDEAPVSYNPEYGFYALALFDDVVAAHRDWPTYSSAHGVELSTLSQDPGRVAKFRNLIMMDPPEHNRYRKLVSRLFTPRAVGRLEEMVRGIITDLLDPFTESGSFDVVADFSALFPVEIIARLVGVPDGERQQIREWLDLALHREPGEMDPTPEGRKALYAMGAYFYELTVAKRADPADDILSDLTRVTIEREDGTESELTDIEIANFATLVGGAGAETVTKLVGNAVVLFAEHADQWDMIREDPSMIPAAVEEILRYIPPSQYQGRFSTDEHSFEGGTVPAGFPVLLLTGSATRDPSAYDRPDEFDITRKPNLSIGFGHGVHSCLGAALARLESRVTLEEFASRWSRLQVDHEGLRRVQMANVSGYSNVPFTGNR